MRPGHDVGLDITMPMLEKLWAIGSDDIDINGFDLTSLHLINEGRADMKVVCDVENLELELLGDGECELWGEGQCLKAYTDKNAELDAEHFHVKTADVEVVNGRALLSVSDTLRQKVFDGRVTSNRNPVVIDFEIENQ